MALLLWLLPLATMAAEPRVWIELETQTLELGEPLRGTLFTSGIGDAPTPDDLNPLEQDFALGEIGIAETLTDRAATGDKLQRLEFTLYPRRSGMLTLPALVLADHRSAPITVEVTPAFSQGVALSVTPKVSSTRPWVRQQVLVTLEVITPDRFASLEIEAHPVPGFEEIALPGERERIETTDGERTRLRSGHALFALTPGAHHVRLPPVHYRLDGGTRRIFPLPEPVLEVKALPPYVPPTLPVGKVSIGSTLETEGLLRTRELGFWHIQVQADAVPPHWLPPLQRRLVSTEDMRFLPAQSDHAAQPDSRGVHARLEHRVPFTAISNGRLVLPELAMDYFDPVTGRLQRVVHRPPSALVLGIPAQLAAGAISLLLLLWVTPGLWRWGVALCRQQRERRTALIELSQAADAATLRAALRRYAAADGGSANISLTEWLQRCGGDVQQEDITTLALASYGGCNAADLHGLRDRLLQRLQARRLF